MAYLPIAVLVLASHAYGQLSTRSYVYDQNGNRTLATSQARFTSAAAFSLEPRRALTGDTVNIYGRNFPYANAASVAVTVAGHPASIISVAPNVITFTMPASTGGGQVLISIAGGAPLVAGDIMFEGITIAPTQVDVAYGELVQFAATVTGGSTQNVTWKVNDVIGGNSSVGTITGGGLYTAPGAGSTVDFPYVVSATSTRIDLTAFAFVLPKCSGVTTLQDEVFANGTLTTPNERKCYQFSGQAGHYVYIAYFGGPSIGFLRLRDSNGSSIASAAGASKLRLTSVLLPRNDVYRVEVEGGTATGSYLVWLNEYSQSARKVWLSPVSDVWSDPLNWTGGTVPAPTADVLIPASPGGVVVTIGSGLIECSAIESYETLRLAGGTLSVPGGILAHSPVELSSGTLTRTKVVASGGPLADAIFVTGSPVLDRVELNGVAEVLDGGNAAVMGTFTLGTRASVAVRGTGSVTSLSLQDGSSVIGDGAILLSGSNARLAPWAANTTGTVGPGVTVRGGGTVYGDLFSGSDLEIFGPIVADAPGQILSLRRVVWPEDNRIEGLSGGTLSLASGNSALGTTTFNVAGGTILLVGPVTHFDFVGRPNSGPLTLQGAVIDGVSLNGHARVPSGFTATINTALTLVNGGTVNVVGGASGSTLYFRNGASLIGNGAVVLGESSSTANMRIPTNSSTGTLGAGITVRGRGNVYGNFGTTGSKLVSLGGPFRGDVSGSALTLSDVEWQGDGSWETESGGLLTLSGTLTATGHSLSVLPSGGEVTLSGTLVGGTLTGGTLVTTSGALNGVTLATTLDAPGATALATILNGLTLNGGVIQLSGANSILYFNGTQTVGGTGEIVMSGGSPSLRPVTNSSTLTVGQGLTVHGRGNVYGNFGTLGSKIVSLGGPFRGDVSGSALTLSDVEWQGDGSWETASGGVLSLSGTLTATGHSLSVLPSGGAVTLSGTLVGGTLTGGTLVTTSGALNGVTLATTLDAPGATAVATILNGLTLNGGVICGRQSKTDPSDERKLTHPGPTSSLV